MRSGVVTFVEASAPIICYVDILTGVFLGNRRDLEAIRS